MVAGAFRKGKRVHRFFEAPALVALVALGGCRKLPVAPPVSSSGDARDTDAICGAGFKWETDHCTSTGASEETRAPGSSEKVRLIGGLRIEEVREGTGRIAKKGDTVRVHYTGALADGSIFDSSRDRGSPLEFELGKGMVIKGFDRGVEGMREGAARRLTIPPELGYGERGMPPKIPPRSTLVFDIELVELP